LSLYSDSKVDAEFGQELVNQKWLTPLQMSQALQKSRASETSLLEVVSKEFGLNEQAIYPILAQATGLLFYDLKNIQVDPSIVETVNVKVAWHYGFMPLRLEKGTLAIAVEYPLNVKTLDEIRLQLGHNLVEVLARKKDIFDLLKKYYGFAAGTVEKIVSKTPTEELNAPQTETAIDPIDRMAGDASVINLVNEIIFDASQKRATDIHLEPYRGEFRLRYRIDGVLYDVNLSQRARPLILAILSRIKIMGNLNIVERRLPQDGRAIVKVNDQNLDLRISSIPTPHGESIVIRVLPTSMIFDFGRLGLTDENAAQLNELIRKPHGIILLTGPTGSGKTTTLYACLSQLNSKENKIITIEDPIEYEIHGITQIQVMPKVGLDFAQGLRSMLRHDPDIMMVGEIRDFETAEIAIRAALTGHLVFSTLHTNDAASGVARLLDIGVEPFLVGSSVETIIAQRLIRTICPQCKIEDPEPNHELIEKIGGMDRNMKIYKGRGCEYCNQTGYYGRTGIHEILVMSEPLKTLISRKASSYEIKAKAIELGLKTLLEDGWKKIAAGTTTPSEVLNVCGSLFETKLQSKSTVAAQSETSEDGSNRRIYKRVPVDFEMNFREIEVRFHSKGSSENDMGILNQMAYAVNISAGGLLVKVMEKPELGSTVEIQFRLYKYGNREVSCCARVVRVEEGAEPGSFYAGLMFLDLSSNDRVYLEDYIARSGKGAANG